MQILPTTNDEIIWTILTDPKLYAAQGNTLKIEDFIVDPSFQYNLIKDKNRILGCFQYKRLTNVVVECHINIISEFWGKSVSLEACIKGLDWFRDNTEYLKVFTDVPVMCEQVHKLVQKLGMQPCGMIKQGCIYKDKLTDLILYDFDLKRDENVRK